MIARIWRGWTSPENAGAYERLLRSEILPGIAERGIAGYRGAHLLRREVEEEVEFTTICWFDTMEAVAEFAGEDPERAVVPDAARRLLRRFDQRSRHHGTPDPRPGDRDPSARPDRASACGERRGDARILAFRSPRTPSGNDPAFVRSRALRRATGAWFPSFLSVLVAPLAAQEAPAPACAAAEADLRAVFGDGTEMGESFLYVTGANPGLQAGLSIYSERRATAAVLSNA